MAPGDKTIVLAGDYGTQRVQVTKPGSAGASITYQAQGTVTIKGFTVKANYITILGFDITNTDDDSTQGWGINVQASYCDIENNHVYYATRGGILLNAPTRNPTVTSNCTVRNNRLGRNSQMGIDIRGRNHLIEGNEVWGSIQYYPKWRNPPSWVDADGMRLFGQGHVIRSNYIHDIHYGIPENPNPHTDCFQTWADSNHEAAQNIVFEKNLCINMDAQSPNEVGQGFMIENATSLVIRNNIIQAYRGINVKGGRSLTIVNNTFRGDLSSTTSYYPAGVTLSGSPNGTIENNLFYHLPGHIIYIENRTSRQGLAAGYNMAYGSEGRPLWVAP